MSANPNLECNENIRKYIFSDEFDSCPVLDKRDKEVILDKLKNGYSYERIGREVNLSGAQIRNIFLRSIDRLKRYLNPKSPETLIEDSLLSARIKTFFRWEGKIKCLADLNNCSVSYLNDQRNLGFVSINEIQEYIKDLGFSLKFDQKKDPRLRFSRKYFEELTDEEILQLIASLSKYIIERRNSPKNHEQ